MDDTISRQSAIDALADYIHMVDMVYSTGLMSADDCKDAAHSVLDDLPSAHPTQTNTPNTLETLDCEYCHEDIEGYVKPIEKNGHAFVCFGMDGWELCLRAKGWHGGTKIRFCPMCGRRLPTYG